MAVDLIGQFQGPSSSLGDVDRVFLGRLQVPVHMRILRMSQDLCGCERSETFDQPNVTLVYRYRPDLAPTYAAILEWCFGCVRFGEARLAGKR